MESNELLMMKRWVEVHGLCGRYRALWDGADGVESLFRLALDANGMSFMAEAMGSVHGLSVVWVRRHFGDYVDGGYVVEHNGYSGCWLCGAVDGGSYVVRSTQLLLSGCDKVIVVPRGRFVVVHVCAGSRVRLACAGRCRLYVYGEGNEVIVDGIGDVERKDIGYGSYRFFVE